MASNLDHRVLGRNGARALSDQEMAKVSGGTTLVTQAWPGGPSDYQDDCGAGECTAPPFPPM